MQMSCLEQSDSVCQESHYTVTEISVVPNQKEQWLILCQLWSLIREAFFQSSAIKEPHLSDYFWGTGLKKEFLLKYSESYLLLLLLLLLYYLSEVLICMSVHSHASEIEDYESSPFALPRFYPFFRLFNPWNSWDYCTFKCCSPVFRDEDSCLVDLTQVVKILVFHNLWWLVSCM